jgi:RHH-type rel operon transcriptional repressor/antitoxin RelB
MIPGGAGALARGCRQRLEYPLKTCYVKHVKQMLGIRLEPELEEKLESLAKETGRSKSYYAREAIRHYLEDREDYLKGIAALERREPTITLDELERRLGLAD